MVRQWRLLIHEFVFLRLHIRYSDDLNDKNNTGNGIWLDQSTDTTLKIHHFGIFFNNKFQTRLKQIDEKKKIGEFSCSTHIDGFKFMFNTFDIRLRCLSTFINVCILSFFLLILKKKFLSLYFGKFSNILELTYHDTFSNVRFLLD